MEYNFSRLCLWWWLIALHTIAPRADDGTCIIHAYCGNVRKYDRITNQRCVVGCAQTNWLSVAAAIQNEWKNTLPNLAKSYKNQDILLLNSPYYNDSSSSHFAKYDSHSFEFDACMKWNGSKVGSTPRLSKSFSSSQSLSSTSQTIHLSIERISLIRC